MRADDHDLVAVQPGETADHGVIVGIKAVAVQFGEIGEGQRHIIQHEGALGMAGDLDPVPGAQAGEDLAARLGDLGFHRRDLLLEADAHGMAFRVFFEFVQLALQLENGLFEIKLMFHRPQF